MGCGIDKAGRCLHDASRFDDQDPRTQILLFFLPVLLRFGDNEGQIRTTRLAFNGIKFLWKTIGQNSR